MIPQTVPSDGNAKAPDCESVLSLALLPQSVLTYVLNMLDVVSLLSLKNTNSQFRRFIEIDKLLVSRCARWRMLAHLEEDLRAQGARCPKKLSCCFCKRSHPIKDFGTMHGNIGYGIERLYLLHRHLSTIRFCWRHIPTRLNYTPAVKRDGLQEPADTDTWVEVSVMSCMHCGTRACLDENGDYTCAVCDEECAICGFGDVPGFERHGPQRPLESYSKLRFIRRRNTGYQLEMRDLNGIQKSEPPKEQSFWIERRQYWENMKHREVSRHLVRSDERQHPLYSPVELINPRAALDIIFRFGRG